MTSVIVAFSKPEDGRSIKGILAKNGYQVISVCTSGAQAIAAAESLDEGIVVSGYRFEDMLYLDLRQYLPDHIDMLMISSPNRWRGQDTGNVICLPMPLKVSDLLSTMDMMVQARTKGRGRRRPKERSQKQQEIIQEAKALLMERNGMPAAEAHSPVYPEMQHGQRQQSGRDGPHGYQPDSLVEKKRLKSKRRGKR